MAFIRYLSEEELSPADRVPDSDNILQVHGVHPEIMRQSESSPVESCRTAGKSLRILSLRPCQSSFADGCRHA